MSLCKVPPGSHRMPLKLTASRLASRDGVSESASGGWAGRDSLGLVAGSGTLELLANFLDAGGAGRGVDGGSVAEVGVDADEELAVAGLDVLDNDVAFGALLAVTARAVELAKGVDCEAIDGHGSGTIVLDDLVFGSGRAAADDGSIAIALDGEGIYRPISPNFSDV